MKTIVDKKDIEIKLDNLESQGFNVEVDPPHYHNATWQIFITKNLNLSEKKKNSDGLAIVITTNTSSEGFIDSFVFYEDKTPIEDLYKFLDNIELKYKSNKGQTGVIIVGWN